MKKRSTYNAPGRPIATAEKQCQTADGTVCRLCHASTLGYAEEFESKNAAVQRFARERLHGVEVQPLVPANPGRFYRRVTKRKALYLGRRIELGLIEVTETGRHAPMSVLACAIEPAAHARIYDCVSRLIEMPNKSAFVDALRYVVIKGGDEEQIVIITVHEPSPDVVHSINAISKALTKEIPSIAGVFLYLDDSDGRYYLGSKDASQRPQLRKIFGRHVVHETVKGRRFSYHPLSFSQVHPGVAESMIDTMGTLLPLDKNAVLYDLYCGYGLFSLCLADRVRSVVGVELSPFSIESAIKNTERFGVHNARFHRGNITPEFLHKAMGRCDEHSVVILDPPRNGTAPGVIDYVAEKHPAAVAHLFCNIEIVPAELKRWEDCGYRVARAIPFDMFPGTDDVELLAILIPALH